MSFYCMQGEIFFCFSRPFAVFQPNRRYSVAAGDVTVREYIPSATVNMREKYAATKVIFFSGHSNDLDFSMQFRIFIPSSRPIQP